MPRKSSDERALGELRALHPRIACPAYISDSDQRSLFVELVALCDYFEQSDAPLLASYCASVIILRRTAEAMQKASGAELKGLSEVHRTMVRSMASLASALKLSPRGRNHNWRSRARYSGPPSAYDTLGLSEPPPWVKP
jgi:phage terminase small subunit